MSDPFWIRALWAGAADRPHRALHRNCTVAGVNWLSNWPSWTPPSEERADAGCEQANTEEYDKRRSPDAALALPGLHATQQPGGNPTL